jgi:hypothetical protein
MKALRYINDSFCQDSGTLILFLHDLHAQAA